MESLSIWSLAGVVLNSAGIMAVRLSTQRVWHTFNYDVTVSNGVNLCHPVLYRSTRLITFTLATENTRKCYQAPFPIFRTGPGNEASECY